MPQPPPQQPQPEIRVEITGDLPAGTRWLYAALTPNPSYCDEYSDDSCGQVFQAEFDPSAGRTFRLAVPEALRTFEYNGLSDTGTGRSMLRVEARADDHCILARGTRLVNESKVTLDLTPPPARVCSVFIIVGGTPAASVSYGDMGICPAAPLGIWSGGTQCVMEQPRDVPLPLKAKSSSLTDVFSRWDGFADCAARAQPDCTLPMNGPAAVRAVFRAL